MERRSRSSRAKSRGAGTAVMQFWVYILRCRDGSYYTGHTDDFEKRLWQHRQGKTCDWTSTRYEALELERRVKNWSRAKKEALIAGDWERVGYFAKPPHERPSTSLGTNESDCSHQPNKDSYVLSPSTPPVGVAQDKLRRRAE